MACGENRHVADLVIWNLVLAQVAHTVNNE